MSGPPVPVGVVGAGHMGRLHARTYAGLAAARLVGVHDLVPERASELAAEVGCRAFPTLEELAAQVRAASVAVSTSAHLEVAERLLARGVDLLVEKPLAPTGGEARRLVDAARAAGALLMVGHSERFNPAVRAIEPLLADPRFVEAHRLAPFSERGTDVDVVLDLMIHDLDLVAHFVRSEVVAIDAVGVPVLTAAHDIANARLRFASGAVANLTASRVSLERMRKLRFFAPDLYVSLDTQNRSARAFRLVREGERARIEALDLGRPGGDDAVPAELGSFLAAVRSRSLPAVPGEHGLRALELAERVHAAIAAHAASARG